MTTGTRTGAAAILAGTVYGGYQYAYPHKTAYRPLARPVPLSEAWAEEPKDGLFLYAHVPFCAMRCGFCNLFTLTRGEGQVGPYLDALRLQCDEGFPAHRLIPRSPATRLPFSRGARPRPSPPINRR